MLPFIITIVILIFIIFIYFYNRLIYKKNQVNNAFSTVDVILQKRSDLIPNLVSLAQIYMQFEQTTLVEISRLRIRANSKRITNNERVILEDQISRTLNKFILALEAYPELKASEHFLQLQYSLTEVEEQLSAARRFYNSAVTEYNNAVEMLPTKFIASWLNYQLKEPFRANLSAINKINMQLNTNL
ncbi:LemA family protein [Nostoc sp. MS1]|uniref:LemA family protein n=1 Tax=Nostoc sp. MS1 TaxID=2764711 RepID=UPI001CC41597|nr:LemA family protein [Nostoc sp. MS1]BCL36704.1 hypothetical protein NSMS1_31510 [Nostoc sp. MS1]